MIDQDTTRIPGADRQGALDRRYDVRIAKRIALLEKQLEALEARIETVEAAL